MALQLEPALPSITYKIQHSTGRTGILRTELGRDAGHGQRRRSHQNATINLDQGSMTVYREGVRFGVMICLSGEYCWAVQELRQLGGRSVCARPTITKVQHVGISFDNNIVLSLHFHAPRAPSQHHRFTTIISANVQPENSAVIAVIGGQGL